MAGHPTAGTEPANVAGWSALSAPLTIRVPIMNTVGSGLNTFLTFLPAVLFFVVIGLALHLWLRKRK